MRRQTIEPQSRFRLQIQHGVALGPGKAQLLEHIAKLGSISAAGKAMGMGCRTAWLLVSSMNEHLKRPLVIGSKGGVGGGERRSRR